MAESQSRYRREHRRSIEEPEAFWALQADAVAWIKKPDRILSRDCRGHDRWFQGGTLNTCALALDFHVANGRADQLALIYDSPVTHLRKTFTYRELRDQTALLAGALAKLGVRKGDRVVIYMPMIPRAVVAMLACARIGAVHSVVFGGFAPHELALRIEDAQPKVVLTASCGIEVSQLVHYKPLVDAAILESRHKPEHVVVYQREYLKAPMNADPAAPPGRDLDWDDFLSGASLADPVPLDAWDPLYILYTSGTTGRPKGIVRDNGGHAVALRYSMEAVFGMKPGDVFWAASDVGWVVGHSYIVYGPLLQGCTTVLFEGKPVKTPDPGAFWRMIDEHKVNGLFCAPTALRAIRKEDPEGFYLKGRDLSSLRALFVAGERLDTATYGWARDLLKVPVVDNWWQTETGWPIVSNMMGLEPVAAKPGSATRPVCGFDVRILDEAGRPVPPGQEGAVALKLPLPPGCLPTLWNDEARFVKGYLEPYPGYFVSGDGGVIDSDGYVFLHGRIDDVINVAGHRLSTAEMEELISRHPAVGECAVFGIEDPLKGQVPVALVVLKESAVIPEADLESELVQTIRAQIGPIASFRRAVVVKRLPKTRSGKILRATLRKILDAREYAVPSTIEDPSVLDEIAQVAIRKELGNLGAKGG